MMKTYRCAYCLMSWIASSYFIPLSMRATATSTGALRAQINRVMPEESDVSVKYYNHLYLKKKTVQEIEFRNRTIRLQQLSQFCQQRRLKSIHPIKCGNVSATKLFLSMKPQLSDISCLFRFLHKLFPAVHMNSMCLRCVHSLLLLVCLSPPQSSYTVNSHTASWILLKFFL